MQFLVRQSIRRDRFGSFNQYYKSIISEEVFTTISKELHIDGNVCEIMDKYFEYTNKFKQTFKTEFYRQFEDYSDINQDGKTKHVND